MKSEMRVKRVETKREMDDFVRLPNRIYAGNPYYVPDLEIDVRETFNPQSPALDQSEIQAFVAYDAKGEPVGRVAGIINHRANEKWHQLNVRFGFIEFRQGRDARGGFRPIGLDDYHL